MKTNGNAFTSPVTTGPPEIEYPLKDHPEHYTVTRQMMVLPGSYSGPPLDAADATYTTAYCVEDTSHKTNGPLLEFERVWSTIPTEKNFNGAQNVTFPAFGTTQTGSYLLEEENGVARQRFTDLIPRASAITLRVPTRIHCEFILPGVGGYQTIDEVPLHLAFRLVDTDGQEVANLEASGASPDEVVYKAWILTGTEIVVKGTALTPYLGNIWKAETIYTKAR